MGIEPTSKAWEALILPMNYARKRIASQKILRQQAPYAFAILIEHLHAEERELFQGLLRVHFHNLSCNVGVVDSRQGTHLIFFHRRVICFLEFEPLELCALGCRLVKGRIYRFKCETVNDINAQNMHTVENISRNSCGSVDNL